MGQKDWQRLVVSPRCRLPVTTKMIIPLWVANGFVSHYRLINHYQALLTSLRQDRYQPLVNMYKLFYVSIMNYEAQSFVDQ